MTSSYRAHEHPDGLPVEGERLPVLLRSAMLFALLGDLVFLAFVIYAMPGLPFTAFLLAAAALILIGGIRMLDHGRVRLAAILVTAELWVVTTFACLLLINELRSLLMVYVGVIAFAGVVLDRRAVMITGVMSAIAWLGVHLIPRGTVVPTVELNFSPAGILLTEVVALFFVGGFVYIIARNTDYTFGQYRQQTQRLQHSLEELRQTTISRAYLDNIIQSMSDMLIVTDAEGRIRLVNHATQRALGLPEAQLIGQPVWQFFEHLDESQPTHFDPNTMEGGERILCPPDGRRIPVSVSLTVMQDEHHRTGVVCVAHDLSQIKEVQAALHLQNERYNRAIQASRAGVWEWDIVNDETYIDANIKAMLGYTEEVFPLDQQRLIELVHPDDREMVWDLLGRHVMGETTALESEHRMLTRDGEIRWFMARGVLERDAQGQPRRVAATAIDVTERKLAEQRLQREQQLFASGPVVSIKWYIEPESPIQYVSANIAQFGYDAGTLMRERTRFTQLVHPEDLLKMREEVHERLRGHEETGEFVYRILTASGEARWVYDYTRYYYTRDGHLEECRGYLLDITTQKQTEEALRRSEQLFRTLTEHTSDFIGLHEPDGRFIYASPSCETILGYAPQEMIGLNPYDFFHPEDAERIRVESHEPLKKGHTINSTVYRMRHKSGEYIWLETYAQSITDSRGQVTQLVTSTRDISERKRSEEQALAVAVEQERVRLVANFINAASHDVRTALATINTSLYLLGRASDEAVRQRRCDVIRKQADRLANLIEGLLTMTRLDSGIEPDHYNYDLNIIVREAASHAEHGAEQHQLGFYYDLQDELPRTPVNASELRMAISNLIDNAVQYTPPGGAIYVRTYTPDDTQIVIEVEDTGTGIEDEDLPHIFERLYRADKARTQDDERIGLGLSIAQKIVTLHDGYIEVETEVGRGSLFRVVLPVKPLPTT